MPIVAFDGASYLAALDTVIWRKSSLITVGTSCQNDADCRLVTLRRPLCDVVHDHVPEGLLGAGHAGHDETAVARVDFRHHPAPRNANGFAGKRRELLMRQCCQVFGVDGVLQTVTTVFGHENAHVRGPVHLISAAPKKPARAPHRIRVRVLPARSRFVSQRLKTCRRSPPRTPGSARLCSLPALGWRQLLRRRNVAGARAAVNGAVPSVRRAPSVAKSTTLVITWLSSSSSWSGATLFSAAGVIARKSEPRRRLRTRPLLILL